MRLESEEEASFFLSHLEWTHPLSRTYPLARSAELALSANSGSSDTASTFNRPKLSSYCQADSSALLTNRLDILNNIANH